MFVSKKFNGLEILISDTNGIGLLPHASKSPAEIEKNMLFKNLDGKAIVFNDVAIYKGSAWGVSKDIPFIGNALTGYFGNVIRKKKLIKRLSKCLFEVLHNNPVEIKHYTGLEDLAAGNYQAFVESYKTDSATRNNNFYYKTDFFENVKEKIEDLDFSPRLLKDVLMEITFQCDNRQSINTTAQQLFNGCLDEKPLIKHAIKNLINLDISLKFLFREKFKSPRLNYQPPSFNPFLNTVENFIALSVYNVEMVFNLFKLLRETEITEIRDFTEEKFNEVRAEYFEVSEILAAVRA